jgi:heme A synthase
MTQPPEPLDVPAAVRAQMLATEHWSLLATRSQTWSEVMSRIMAQFTFTSAVLVVLALAFQQRGYDGTFRTLVLGLGAAVLLTGTLTSMRVAFASHEDASMVRGMNRLRRAYIDIDPGVAPYFVTGTSDDEIGLGRTYTMGPDRTALQFLASAAMFIVVVNALVAGGWIGIMVSPLGTAASVVLGLLGGLAYVGAFIVAGYRMYIRSVNDPDEVRFPTPPED